MESSTPSTPFFTDTYGSSYRLIEPGTFLLGDEHGTGNPTEQPACTVEITRPFFLAERPVTQAFWLDVMGENHQNFRRDGVQGFVQLNRLTWMMSINFFST